GVDLPGDVLLDQGLQLVGHLLVVGLVGEVPEGVGAGDVADGGAVDGRADGDPHAGALRHVGHVDGQRVVVGLGDLAGEGHRDRVLVGAGGLAVLLAGGLGVGDDGRGDLR